jgi:tRNA pseudouridine55 synthase
VCAAKRSSPDDPAGLIVIDKPGGMTSHDVVSRVRRLARTRRVGHGGTLDPMATGVLVIGVGRATRLLTYVIGADKRYRATIRLGESTITDDAEGAVVARTSASAVADADIRAGLAAQTGTISQVPSAVSAIKINGQRAYAKVRAGESVELAARTVTISAINVLDIRRSRSGGGSVGGGGGPVVDGLGVVGGSVVDGAGVVGGSVVDGAGVAGGPDVVDVDVDHLDVVDVDVEVACSTGTYVRAIARDLGASLGVGGHLIALRRTAVGAFTLAESVTLDALTDLVDAGGSPVALSLDDATARFFARRDATPEEAVVLSHGGPLSSVGLDGPYAVFGPGGSVIAIVTERDGKTRAEVVFAPA